ncbi:MAG TPA: hypothetical protein DEG63_11045, partial [Flavobacteriaceae bacterium]|nr:hypothetical protein [Flavobacteriaceae bacterium]
LDAINHSIDNDYTPLGVPIYPDTGEFPILGNYIPLISDPTLFDEMHSNWNEHGHQIGQCALKIIENDKDLSIYLDNFFSDGVQPIIDPIFKSEQELEEGIYIKDIEKLNQQAINKDITHSYTPTKNANWKAGDRVKIVFPDIKTNEDLKGILLTDEFKDEINEQCVIFRPIEKGIIRDDMQFKMPTKLLVKD